MRERREMGGEGGGSGADGLMKVGVSLPRAETGSNAESAKSKNERKRKLLMVAEQGCVKVLHGAT